MPGDEAARRGQHGHAIPRALLEPDGAREPTVEGRVRSFERLGPHVLVVEDVSEQAADLRIGRPPRDGLEIGREGADELVVLRGVAPDLPARQPTLGEPAEEGCATAGWRSTSLHGSRTNVSGGTRAETA